MGPCISNTDRFASVAYSQEVNASLWLKTHLLQRFNLKTILMRQWAPTFTLFAAKVGIVWVISH